jgi:hypothetical protein
MAAMRNTHRGDFLGGGQAAVAGRHARTADGLARGERPGQRISLTSGWKLVTRELHGAD